MRDDAALQDPNYYKMKFALLSIPVENKATRTNCTTWFCCDGHTNFKENRSNHRS